MIYAFGTSSWSVSSQALWQHGPSQLFLTLLLFCLVRGMKEDRFLAYAGFAMTSAMAMRPIDVLIALPVGACVLYTRPRSTLRFSLFALPPMAGLLLYYVRFGSADGGIWNTTAPIWAYFTQVPLVDGLAGVLLGPSRGLFVYSPVLLFSVARAALGWAPRPSTPEVDSRGCGLGGAGREQVVRGVGRSQLGTTPAG